MVSRDVPGYAVVVGNPGKIVRMRFDDATISELEKTAWWDWPDQRVIAAVPDLTGRVEDFLVKYAR